MAGVSFVKVKESDDGIRLNRWFLREYPSLSMGRLQKLLRTKQIKVDGKKADTNTRLSAGSELRLPPLDNEKAQKDPTRLSKADEAYIRSLVIYTDEHLIVLNKPSGLAVQGGTNTTRHIDGMLDGLMFEADSRPRLVHRIDKETSGLLVLARDRRNAEVLTKAFREHQLPKTYLVLCRGTLPSKSGEINAPLEKIGEKMQVSNAGKKAVTTYRVLDTVGERFTLAAVSPLTGRTHQIRAHLEHLGCPIVGDSKYFGTARIKDVGLSPKLHLHAYMIDLSGVLNKKTLVKAPLPSYFKEDLDFLGMTFKENKIDV